MNHLEEQHGPYPRYNESQSYAKLQQLLSTVALLFLGYYVLSFFDAWPSTTKRTLYELIIRSIPSRFIYILQHAMVRFGRLSDQGIHFGRENFGDFKAKEEALQQMLGNTPIPNVLHRARALSGYDKIMPVSKEFGPPGLGNWDNSCYQNSVLQGFASLPAFQHYVQRSLLLCQKTGTSSNTTGALTTFLDQLSDASCHKQTIWTPKVLKSMDSWQQQDAQEYFSRVLESIEKEAMNYTKAISRSTSPGLNCLRSDGTNVDREKEKAVQKILQVLVGNPMDGMFAQALSCQTCGFSEGVTMTQFNCLTLNLGLAGQRSIETLLDEYTNPELIEGVECDNCTRIANKQPATDNETEAGDGNETSEKKDVKKELRVKAKQITFGRLPKDLVIHVNRSIWDDYGNQIKNPSFVHFPSRLEISDQWCAPLETGMDQVQAVYELKCIVTHSGRHDNGHYVACGKRDKEWYSFNDEIVTKISEEQVLARGNVFMLFYEAIDRSELSVADDEEDVHAESSVLEGSATPSASSVTDSEVYEEPLANSSNVPLPAMRTASGGVYSVDQDKAVGPTFVSAI